MSSGSNKKISLDHVFHIHIHKRVLIPSMACSTSCFWLWCIFLVKIWSLGPCKQEGNVLVYALAWVAVLLVLHSAYDSNWSDAKLTFRQNLLNGLNLSSDTQLEAEVRTQACFRHTLLVLQMPPPPLAVPLFVFVLIAVIQTVGF